MEDFKANIKIVRHGEELFSIAVIMPFWNRLKEDNTILVDIPLFGIKTFARNEEDAEVAVDEAVRSFCIAAEKFGKGIEAELASLGWRFEEEEDEDENSMLNYNPHDAVLAQIMETGERCSNNLVLAE